MSSVQRLPNLLANMMQATMEILKVRAVSNFDKTVERLDRQYISIRSTDPEALCSKYSGLIKNIES